MVTPWAFLFLPSLVKNETFLLRDSGDYYFRVFQWNANQWKSGNVPLWNPQDNLGIPVVADATSSVFYPFQILLLLPDFATGYTLYVSLHFLIASFAAYFLARKLDSSLPGAILTAVTYSYGGAVIFQNCNVIFLVGAAWLPIILSCGFSAIKGRSWKYGAATAAALAMTVLGGEPQTAYHAMIALAILALFYLPREVTNGDDENEAISIGESMRFRAQAFAIVLTIGSTAILLSAIQILPSMNWASRSVRSNYKNPRNVREIPEYLSRDDGEGWSGVAEGFFQKPEMGTHHHHIYQFSVPPWSLIELIWPNVTGKIAPTHRRWASKLPGADRMWQPSIYMGGLTVLLWLSVMFVRNLPAKLRWIRLLLLFFLVGSLGWYGVGWAVHEFSIGILGIPPDQIPIGSHVGGIYWMMSSLLPGYENFRYPAKLFVMASLGISIFAGLGFDRAIEDFAKFKKWIFVFGFVSLLGLIAVSIGKTTIVDAISKTQIDPFFGPIDAAGSWLDIRNSFIHAVLVALVGYALFWLASIRTGKDREESENHSPQLSEFRSRYQFAILFVLGLDVLVANSWMLETTPSKNWSAKSSVADSIENESQNQMMPARFYRSDLFGDGWVPQRRLAVGVEGAETRFEQALRWNQETLFPKHHLDKSIGLVESFNSLSPQDHEAWFQIARSVGVERNGWLAEPNSYLLSVLATEHALFPANFEAPTFREMRTLQGFSLHQSVMSFPRCWVVRNVVEVSPIKSKNPMGTHAKMGEILFEENQLRDLGRVAVVETDQSLNRQLSETFGGQEGSKGKVLGLTDLLPYAQPDERCEVVSYSPTEVRIEMDLKRPGFMVLSEYFDSGWVATLEKDSVRKAAEIYKTNGIMRGVFVPAGKHKIVMRYRPIGLMIGAGISSLAWLVWLALAGLMIVGSVRRGQIAASLDS